jgi:hypothetical protein
MRGMLQEMTYITGGKDLLTLQNETLDPRVKFSSYFTGYYTTIFNEEIQVSVPFD